MDGRGNSMACPSPSSGRSWNGSAGCVPRECAGDAVQIVERTDAEVRLRHTRFTSPNIVEVDGRQAAVAPIRPRRWLILLTRKNHEWAFSSGLQKWNNVKQEPPEIGHAERRTKKMTPGSAWVPFIPFRRLLSMCCLCENKCSSLTMRPTGRQL